MIHAVTPRIADKDAVGLGVEEAEKAISYVPYRNTLLMTILGAYIENQNVNFAHIIFGGNSSHAHKRLYMYLHNCIRV